MFKRKEVEIPDGISIRKLREDRRAQGQGKGYKYSGWRDNESPVYGNSINEVVKKLI